MTIRECGKDAAILKAAEDIKKANKDLLKNSKYEAVSKWSTYLSLPVGTAESLLGGSYIGLTISGVTMLNQLRLDINKRKNNWINVVR
jgi:hypothetical protein